MFHSTEQMVTLCYVTVVVPTLHTLIDPLSTQSYLRATVFTIITTWHFVGQ